MAKSKETLKLEEKLPNCFIIMPFGGWFDNYYKEVYIPAIENAGFLAKRADDLYRPGNIVNDIWKYTKEADIILADLTTKNPNVFYELGLAHAITKPAILITASMEDVPFDLRSLRVIEYDKNSPRWGESLQYKITLALKDTLKNPEDAIPPTFFEVNKSRKLQVSTDEKEYLELRNDVELLKREIRSTKNFRRTPSYLYDGSTSAETYIKDMLTKDYPIELIRKNLKNIGIPEKWIEAEIESILNKTK